MKEFIKKIIGNEFVFIVDENGNFKYSLVKSILISLCMCVCVGLIWYLLDGETISFIEGFFFPFVCIIISIVFGLPVYFIEKKNKDVANVIKKIGMGLGIVFVIGILLLMIFLEA